MDKATLIQKMEEYVQSYREQLEKNDGSSLSALANNAMAAFENVKDAIMGNETARKGLDKFKESMDAFEKAVRDGDKKLSAKAVTKMEETIRDMKQK